MKHISIIQTKHGERYLLRGVKVHKKGGKGYKKGSGNKFISKAHYNRLKKEGVKIVGLKGYKKREKKTSKTTKKRKGKKGGRRATSIPKSKMNTIIKCCKDILKKSH